MTEHRHADQADAGGGALRAGRRRGLSWGRVLPGGVVVFAALTMPEFSVGAGDLAVGERQDDPVTPPATARLGGIKPAQAVVKAPLAGVRYASLLSITETPATSFVVMPESSALPAGRAPSLPDAEPVEMIASLPLPEPVVKIAALPVAAAEPLAQISAPLAVAASAAVASLPVAMEEPPLELLAARSLAAHRQLVSLSAQDREGDTFSSPAPQQQAALAVPSAPVPAPAAAITAMPGAMPLTALEQIVPAAQALAPVTMPPAAATPATSVAGPQISAAMAAPVTKPAPGMSAVPAPARTPAPKVAASPAKMPAAAPAPVSRPAGPTAALVAVPSAKPPVTATGPGASVPQGGTFPLDITARLVTRVDGKAAGAVDFRQTATGLSVRLGSIVDVLGDRYDPAQIARIRASAASNLYLSLAELQAQGIPISYDPVYDEFNVGLTDTRPKAARKVHMDQISVPERGLGSAGIDQVRR